MKTIRNFLLIVAASFSISAWASVEITGFEVSEAAGTGTWNVTVDPGVDFTTGEGVVGIDYQLDYTTVDDTAEDENGDNDYKKQEGNLDFSSGLTQQVVVPIVQDQKVEGNEQLKLELYERPIEGPSSVDQAAGPVSPVSPVATGTGTIIDDDIELLVKVAFQGVGGGPVDLILDCEGNGVIDDSTKTTVNGEAKFEVYNFIEPLDCTAVPVSSPPGSTIISTDCDPGMDEGDTQCLIVFGGTRATFQVTKIFADGNNEDEIEVSIDCNTGLILDQDKNLGNNEEVTFVVTSFNEGTMTCTITEDGQAGYGGEYDNVTLVVTSNLHCQYTEVGGLDEHECVITNTPLNVDLNITKVWLYPGSANASAVSDDFRFVLYCSNASIVGGANIGGALLAESPSIIVPIDPCAYGGDIPLSGNDQYCKTLSGWGNKTFIEKVNPYTWPGGSCYVVEIDVDPAVEVDNGCGSLEVSAGSGDSCTITNTVFFEGIPTLSHYSMAILALLMLGIGLVGFRRFS